MFILILAPMNSDVRGWILFFNIKGNLKWSFKEFFLFQKNYKINITNHKCTFQCPWWTTKIPGTIPNSTKHLSLTFKNAYGRIERNTNRVWRREKNLPTQSYGQGHFQCQGALFPQVELVIYGFHKVVSCFQAPIRLCHRHLQPGRGVQKNIENHHIAHRLDWAFGQKKHIV